VATGYYEGIVRGYDFGATFGAAKLASVIMDIDAIRKYAEMQFIFRARFSLYLYYRRNGREMDLPR
jgi:hypothetical protein